MNTVKADVETLLLQLPDDCSLEDIQYHLYVLEKVRQGLEATQTHGTLTQNAVEERLKQWLMQ